MQRLRQKKSIESMSSTHQHNTPVPEESNAPNPLLQSLVPNPSPTNPLIH